MHARLTQDFEAQEDVSTPGAGVKKTTLQFKAGAILVGYLARQAIAEGKAQEIPLAQVEEAMQ